MRDVLPPLPTVDPGLLAESDRVHALVHERLGSLEPDAALLVRRIAWRRLAEAAASAGGIEYDSRRPVLLLPPRRRSLPDGLATRLTACTAALDHITERIRRVDLGLLDHVLSPETPIVLNALAAGSGSADDGVTAGLIRVTESSFLDEGAEFVPPPAARCRELLDTVVATVRDRPAVHHLELAAWTSLLLFAVHPFSDGNGRTARLLFHALHSSALPGRHDIGSVESWSAHRRRYIEAIQRATPASARNDVARILPDEFARFAAEQSVAGAVRWLDRIAAVEAMTNAWRASFGEATLTYAHIAIERNVPPEEFIELGDRAAHVEFAEQLLAVGAVVRDPLGRYSPAAPGIVARYHPGL